MIGLALYPVSDNPPDSQSSYHICCTLRLQWDVRVAARRRGGAAARRRKGAAVRRRGGPRRQPRLSRGGAGLIPGGLPLLVKPLHYYHPSPLQPQCRLKTSEIQQGGNRAQNGGLPCCWTPIRLGHVPEDHVNVRHSLHQDCLEQRDPHAQREQTARPLHDVNRGIRTNCTTVRNTFHLKIAGGSRCVLLLRASRKQSTDSFWSHFAEILQQNREQPSHSGTPTPWPSPPARAARVIRLSCRCRRHSTQDPSV